MSKTSAGINASAEQISQMNYWQAKQKAVEIRAFLDGECPLDDRPAVLSALVMLQKQENSFSDDAPIDQGAVAIQKLANQGQYKKANDLIAATGSDLRLERPGDESNAYFVKLQEQRDARVPEIMKQLNIDEERAVAWYDKFESPDKIPGSRPPITLTTKSEAGQ